MPGIDKRHDIWYGEYSRKEWDGLMKNKKRRKLTKQEAARLVKYVDENGGQIRASISLGVAPETLSRSLNLHTAPSQMLTEKLVKAGIIKE